MNNENQQPKLGISLSGGGFRASFFHIGVLARLAELDLLKHIEVISTVSGGSIIGTLYYLHVKNRWEQSGKSRLDTEDYLQIVDEVACSFLETVQKIFTCGLSRIRSRI